VRAIVRGRPSMGVSCNVSGLAAVGTICSGSVVGQLLPEANDDSVGESHAEAPMLLYNQQMTATRRSGDE